MVRMTRRDAIRKALLAASAGGLASRALPRLMAQASGEATLKSSAERIGVQAGTAATQQALQNPAIAEFVIQQFDLLTASGLKWGHLRPTPTTFNFAEADWNMNFAQQHGMRVHGHNLCWNAPVDNPGWFRGGLNKSNARAMLTSHIDTVVSRYKGRIESWDVVNEAVVPWPVPGGLYPGIWLDLLGPEYIDIAFHAAAAADPKALLILNVHHLEQENADSELNRQRVLQVLKQLLARKVPVQAVGIESHLGAFGECAGVSFQQFLRDIHSLGLKVLITELDVQENRSAGASLDWDRSVARCYGDYLRAVLGAVRPEAVIFWSMTDRWENGKKIQGLLQTSYTPRLTLPAALNAFEQARRSG
jgi:endo-1,4-beta-xylanase